MTPTAAPDRRQTIACALMADRVCPDGGEVGVKVAHVETGFRSFDRTMPEEINRVLTDQI